MADRADRVERMEAWVQARSERVMGRNPWSVLLSVGQRFSEVRVPGLAAEMTYYSLISLIPIFIVVGASLGLIEIWIGAVQARAVEDTISAALRQIFHPDISEEVLDPLVTGLLGHQRTGVALVSLLITFLFASAVFRAAIRALDDAYGVNERRGFLHVWSLAYLLALGSVFVMTVVIPLLVIGPLVGAQHIAEWFGLGRTFELIWLFGRWPLVFLLCTVYLSWLYHVGPNVDHQFKLSLPGAAVASFLAILITQGLQLYLEFAGPRAPAMIDAQEAVQIASQTIGALLAVILWIWLISIAVLTGGVINAVLNPDFASKKQRLWNKAKSTLP